MVQKKKTGAVKKVGLGLAVTAAAVAGAYWLYGSENASKNRKMAKGWMLKARGEVLEAVEKLGDIDKAKYLKTVGTVLKKYAKDASTADMKVITKDLKDSWSHISTHFGSVATTPKKKTTKKK